MEELFSGLKKGKSLDEIFENSHIEGFGRYGGKILSETEIEDWAKILKKKFGTKLERVESFDNPTVLAAFDPNTNTIKYIDDVTEYLMTHESFHAEEMFKIGFKEYTKNAHIKDTPWTIENRIHEYMREKYVYERLVQHSKKHKFNPEELSTPPFGHAYQYFDTLKFKLEILLKENNIPFPN